MSYNASLPRKSAFEPQGHSQGVRGPVVKAGGHREAVFAKQSDNHQRATSLMIEATSSVLPVLVLKNSPT